MASMRCYLRVIVSNLSSLSVVYNDISNLCSSFQFIAWSYVKRNGNVLTHILAKSSPIEVGVRCWLGNGLDFIADAVTSDICDVCLIIRVRSIQLIGPELIGPYLN